MIQDKIVILYTFSDPIEASIARDKLTENNISSFLEDENPIGLNPLGGVELKVFEKDFETANKLIEELKN